MLRISLTAIALLIAASAVTTMRMCWLMNRVQYAHEAAITSYGKRWSDSSDSPAGHLLIATRFGSSSNSDDLAVTSKPPPPPPPPPYQPALFLKYDRRLCTGIGDRMSVFLAVAAMARAVNASCYVHWLVTGQRLTNSS